ncbi:MAG: hypothetical protein ACI3ZY_02415 [Parabacteroides sp.]
MLDRQFTYINEVVTPGQAIKFQSMGLEQRLCIYYWKAFMNDEGVLAFGLYESGQADRTPQLRAADSVLTEWMGQGFDPDQVDGRFMAAFSTAQMMHLLGDGMALLRVVEGGFQIPDNERVFRYYEMAEAVGELLEQLVENEVLSVERINWALRIYSQDSNQIMKSVCEG